MFLAVLVLVAAGVLAATTTTITPGTAIAGETDLFCHIYVDGQEVSVNDISPYTIAWKSDAIGATWDYLGVQELDSSYLSEYMNHELICAVGHTYTQGGYVIFIDIPQTTSNSVPIEPDYTPSANLIVPSQAYVNENVQLQCSASGGNDPLAIEIDAEGNGDFQDVTGTGILNHVYTETGNYNPVCRVTDLDSDVATDDANIEIISEGIENHAPVITSVPVTEVYEGHNYYYQVNAVDPNGDSMEYSLITSPSWLSIDSQTGLVSGTAPEVDEDTGFDIIVRVSDTEGAFDTQTYILTVMDIVESENLPPVITSVPVTEVDEQEVYTYDVEAYDPDGDILTYSLTQGPSWLSIDSQTGLVSGTAPEVDEDTGFDIIVRVSDTEGAFDTQTFTITVQNVEEPEKKSKKSAKGSTGIRELPEDEFYQTLYLDQFNTEKGIILEYESEEESERIGNLLIWLILLILLIFILITIVSLIRKIK